MIKDAAKALREPIAWVLLGCVFISLILGLWEWFGDTPSSESQPLLYGAYYADGNFINLTVGACLLGAVVAVALLPGPTKFAKPITLVTIIMSGLMLLLGVLGLFLQLFYEGGEYTDRDLSDKGQEVLNLLPGIAFVLIPLLVGLAVLRSQEMSPRPQAPVGWSGMPQQPQPGQPMPGYGQPQPQPQQQQQPYGWPGGGQPPPSGPPMSW